MGAVRAPAESHRKAGVSCPQQDALLPWLLLPGHGLLQGLAWLAVVTRNLQISAVMTKGALLLAIRLKPLVDAVKSDPKGRTGPYPAKLFARHKGSSRPSPGRGP
jgi:hypothetical protein